MAMVLLNTPNREADFLRAIWGGASYRVVADGAANRLMDSLPPALQRLYVPDLICGDMDSLRDDVR